MITALETGRSLHVRVRQANSLETALNAAADLVMNAAIGEGRHGVLITRFGPACFTVAVSADVPYGLTRESEQWTRTPEGDQGRASDCCRGGMPAGHPLPCGRIWAARAICRPSD